MKNFQYTFERTEQKYLITLEQMDKIITAVKEMTRPDEYGKSSILNIYYDTPDFMLIRASIEKPLYKEKLRLRSYGIPSPTNAVFIELKKKYKGVVFKRRTSMSYSEAISFLNNNTEPKIQSQIIDELKNFKDFYKNLYPAMLLSYDRIALYSIADQGLRLTFDTNITWRMQDVDLLKGAGGNLLLDEQSVLMEIKAYSTIPLWLVRILSELKIYPSSFSKYGKAYSDYIINSN
ncbi:polyphosphate polymerase domain-containing protein [Eubacteriales bacterium OttesenSCG-928-G02]|nr:polyphosphate polymerase domain-containing protein [Eubacteriales bacterium OttesenSCG-928-G02]